MLAVDMADQMSTGQKEFFFEDLLEVIGDENGPPGEPYECGSGCARGLGWSW